MILAALILLFVWLLQVYFLDNYYERMKLRETQQEAHRLIMEYQSGQADIFDILKETADITQHSDTYVVVATGFGTSLQRPDYTINSQLRVSDARLNALRLRLFESGKDSYTEITTNPNNTKTLAYIAFLKKCVKKPDTATEGSGEGSGRDGSDQSGGIAQDTPSGLNEEEEPEDIDETLTTLIYFFSPLYPVDTTVSILRTQLLYITVISLGASFLLALYLSRRMSDPIRQITESASEMGRGNYGVKFERGYYSEINELAETLTDTSRELEKTETYQKDLIANVSHDLRTPLTMIQSYAEMIRDLSGNDPDKRSKHLQVIIEESQRLNTLVNDMLMMSRLQQRRVALNKTNFDLTGVTAEQVDSYSILTENDDYDIRFERPGRLIVNADQERIKQVISNLMSNAVKYCGDDKTIIVALKKLGSIVRLEVSDHGMGIAEDELTHVWERYYKSSTHHVRSAEGTGLGLSIVKEILEMHKAEYGVESQVGEGTTFWFELELISQKKKRSL